MTEHVSATPRLSAAEPDGLPRRRERAAEAQLNAETPGQDDGLGSERGLATPCPDGMGRECQPLSLMIMPLDS